MLIRLGSDFTSLDANGWSRHELLIDELIWAHRSKHHLLCLTPQEVVKIRNFITLGRANRDALDLIARRCQDYLASSRNLGAILVIQPSGVAALPGGGREYVVAASDARRWYSPAPGLYVENATTDGGVYRFLIKQGARYLNRSDAHVVVAARHGGGTTMAALLLAEGPGILGMCVSDRDSESEVPPFGTGKTARLNHDVLCGFGLCDAVSIGRSAKHPFFGFFATRGCSLENYIGPHLLAEYFNAHPSAYAERSKMLDVFPNYPSLNEEEMSQWWVVNFRSANQNSAELQRAFGVRFGVHLEDARSSMLAEIVMPDNVPLWVSQSWIGGRYARLCASAFQKDMQSAVYNSAIRELVDHALLSLAADEDILGA